jgi:flagellar biosynthetic protein FliP
MLLIISVLLALLPAAAAQGQAVSAPIGPPSLAQVQRERQEQLQKTLNDSGLGGLLQATGSGVSASSGGVSNAGETPLPDVTQVVPTTTDPKKLSASLQILLLLSILTLAPSILLMTTCFTRIIIVMSLLRQALGAAQLPPNQVLIGLSLFMTFLVMGPTWSRVNQEAIVPYNNGKITQMEAFERATGEVRKFMIRQIEGAHNEDDVYMFHNYAHPNSSEPKNWEDVETTTLVPAFVLSELKVAFLMGFRIYLPFLIIDMVISSVLISIGMQLLPPVMVSLPFKLLLFVLVDGWHLVCGTLLASFGSG